MPMSSEWPSDEGRGDDIEEAPRVIRDGRRQSGGHFPSGNALLPESHRIGIELGKAVNIVGPSLTSTLPLQHTIPAITANGRWNRINNIEYKRTGEGFESSRGSAQPVVDGGTATDEAI